jgi:murein DD-endopeptidase MepM/ murein hydrolase activator NlpD
MLTLCGIAGICLCCAIRCTDTDATQRPLHTVSSRTSPSDLRSSTPAHDTQDETGTSDVHTRHYSVKPGDTFARILSSLHIPYMESVLRGYRRLQNLGLSCIHPGDSVVVQCSDSGYVRTLSILSRQRCWYRIVTGEDTCTVEKAPLPVTTHRCIARGTIGTSIYESMRQAGCEPALVYKFVNLFAWDVNFFLDCREGDTFRILYEKKYIGDRFYRYGAIHAASYTATKYARTYHAYAFTPRDSDTLHHFNSEGHSVQRRFLKSPLKFSRISSGFSYNRAHPILGVVRPHLGMDYAAPSGTPVYAASDGTVTFVGTKGGYGRHIRIRHRGMYTSYYSHLRSYARGIRPGAQVNQGDFIGRVGSTGLSTGPHLDYRVKRGNSFVNPLTMSSPPTDSLDTAQKQVFTARKKYYQTVLSARIPGAHGEYVLDTRYSTPEKRVAYMTRDAAADQNNDK